MSRSAVASLATFLLCPVAIACVADRTDALLEMRSWADDVVVKVSTVGTSECTGEGTGFVVSAQGLVLTAGHVVPPQCSPQTTAIRLRWISPPGGSKLSGPIDAEVVARSTLDVVALRPSKPLPGIRQFLRLAKQGDLGTYKYRCTLLAGFHPGQTDSYHTFAEIASTALDDGIGWALTGEGFNQGRSGSPVILADGTVVAMFLSRPIDPEDRDRLIQSRARVLPLSAIPRAEIDLAAMSTLSGSLRPFLSRLDERGGEEPGQVVRTAFGVSITELGGRLDPALPTFLLNRQDHLRQVDSLGQALIEAALTGSSIVRRIEIRRKYQASPGYAFEVSAPRFSVASQNPKQGPLPDRTCETESDGGCYRFSDDRRTVELRYYMFPGMDGRRSWLDAEVNLTQVRQ